MQASWPLDLVAAPTEPPHAGSAPAQTTAPTPAPLADPTAWYIGLQGRHFYQRLVRHPKRAVAGELLSPPVEDGTETLTSAPVDGNFYVTANRSSDFEASVVFDFDYKSFAAAGCGGDSHACGLSAVGAASAGGVTDHPPGTAAAAELPPPALVSSGK